MPLQMQSDIEELCAARVHGGRKLVQLVFRAIVQARGLTVAESVMLSDKLFKTFAARAIRW